MKVTRKILFASLDTTYFEGITSNGIRYTIFSNCEWENGKNVKTNEIIVNYLYSLKNKNGNFIKKEKSYVIGKSLDLEDKIHRWEEVSRKYCDGKLNIKNEGIHYESDT